eukprot:c9584_g1_i1.p1 GENE.c9584_g1_i1~~c9584_g1_i1.p1  ORF type:complete len:105 (-),score=28.12 c9584_g1_i1:125-439(-)
MTKRVNLADTTETTISEGEVLTIEVRGNRTTGYSWTADVEGGAPVSVESTYIPDSVQPGVCGAGGKFEFQLKASQKGTHKISFKHGRSWEPEPITTKTLTLEVV